MTAEATGVVVCRRADAQAMMEGDELAFFYFQTGKLVLVGSTLPPGGSSPMDPGHAGAHEVVLCTAGRIVIEFGAGSDRSAVHLDAGDAALIDEGVPHRVVNPGPEQAEMTWCTAPDLGRPMVYEPAS